LGKDKTYNLTETQTTQEGALYLQGQPDLHSFYLKDGFLSSKHFLLPFYFIMPLYSDFGPFILCPFQSCSGICNETTTGDGLQHQ